MQITTDDRFEVTHRLALSLRTKIVLFTALPLLAIHVLVFVYAEYQHREQSLVDQARWLIELARVRAADTAAAPWAPHGLRDHNDITAFVLERDAPIPGADPGDRVALGAEHAWRLSAFDGTPGPFVLVEAEVPGQSRRVVLITPEAALLAGLEHRLWWLNLLVATSASLILLLGWIAAIRISEPLEDLDTAAREIAGGNLSVTPTVRSNDEIGRLAQAIGTLSRRIEQRDGELRLTRDNLERRIAERTRELTREIARRQRVEGELRTAEEAASRASQAKSEFLSNMSHELRTPLNGVLGYTQVLRRDPGFSERQRDNLQAIEHCGEHLLTLINDVLDLAKIEAGRLSAELTATDLAQLLHDVHDIVAHRARDRGLSLAFDIDPELPRGVRTDGTKLRQILLNLLGNAIKFTDHGEIRLRARASGDQLSFSVSDTGRGIPAAEMEKVFDAFHQAGSNADAGGTGLGLSINQHLIRILDGTPMTVTSNPGEGSSFAFSIPLLEVPDDALPVSPSTEAGAGGWVLDDGERARALVVDDNADSRDVLGQTLTIAGFESELVPDAPTALVRLRERRFDLVLMDIHMPGVSGLDVIAEIRALPDLARLPVLALTANVLPEAMAQTRAAGFDDVIGKPFRVDDLVRRCADVLGLNLVPRTASPPPSAPEAPAVPTASWPDDIARDAAHRIQNAATVGDVTTLGDIADDLESRLGADDPTLSAIRRLIRTFDFSGLETIAAELARGSVPRSN